MLFFVVLLLLCIKAYSAKNVSYLYEKKNLTTFVKYIAAIGVIISHLTGFHSVGRLLALECACGWVAVGVFFFFSGYGLMYGFMCKGKSYFNSFLSKRLNRICIPLVSAYLLYSSVYILISHSDWKEVLVVIISRFFSFDPFLPFSWFVSMIILLYLLFFIVGRTFREGLFMKRFLFIYFIMFLGFEFLDFSPWVTNSMTCFPLGIVYRKYEGFILNKILQYKKSIIPLFLIIFATSYNWIRIGELCGFSDWFLYNPSHQILSSLVFVLLMCFILNGFNELKFKKTPLLNSSYELYLVQGSVFAVVSCFMYDSYAYYGICIFLCILVGYIMMNLNNFILGLLKNDKK